MKLDAGRALARRALARMDESAAGALVPLASTRPCRLALAALAHSADSLICIPALAALWWVQGFSFRAAAFPPAAGYAVAVFAVAAMKLAIRRPRPEGDWGAIYRRTDPRSFPSGHAARTMALAAACAVSGLGLPAVLLAPWSVAVGLARAALGVHHFSDVAAGWAVGAAAGALGAALAPLVASP